MGCSCSRSRSTSTSTSGARQREIALFNSLVEIYGNGNEAKIFADIQKGSRALKNSGEAESFSVVITKEKGVPFGAALDKDNNDEVAIVTSIDGNGFLKAWNEAHPAKEVRLGDRIVAVNDCKTDYWEMVAQLWWCAGEFRLTVERDPYKATSQHRFGSRVLSDQTCRKLAYGASVDCLHVIRAADVSANGCAVCLEDYEDPEAQVVVLPCNHVFHSACVGRWLCKGSTCCPLCKALVSAPATTQESAGHAIDIVETHV